MHDLPTRRRWTIFSSRSAAFTLVELLVVIGIIALLVAILLPVLNKARAAAATIQCASNMRQIGQAVFLFAGEHDGRAPGGGQRSKPSSSTVAWQEILSLEYFKQKDYIPRLAAPSGAKLACPVAMSGNFTKTMRSYVMNTYLVGHADPPEGVLKLEIIPAEPMSSYYKPISYLFEFSEYHLGAKLIKFKNPATKVMLKESDGSADIFGYSKTDAAPVLGDNPSYPPWDSGSGSSSWRHPKFLMNVLYMDGHVESSQPRGDLFLDRYVLPGK